MNPSYEARLQALLSEGKISIEQWRQMRAALEGIPAGPHAAQSPDAAAQQDVAVEGARDSEAWLAIRFAFVLMALILLMFTPFTNQLDEIKATLLLTGTPILLLLSLRSMNLSQITWRNGAPLVLLGLFGASQLVSLILNPAHWALSERMFWSQIAAISFAGVFGGLLLTVRRVRAAVNALAVMSLALAVLGLMMYWLLPWVAEGTVGKPSPSHEAFGWWDNLLRTLSFGHVMHSTLLNSDFFAFFCMMTAPVCLAAGLVAARQARRLLALAAFGLLVVCLALTKSVFVLGASAVVAMPVFLVLGYVVLIRRRASLGIRLAFGLAVLGAWGCWSRSRW